MSAPLHLRSRLQPEEPVGKVRVLALRYTGQKAEEKVGDWCRGGGCLGLTLRHLPCPS